MEPLRRVVVVGASLAGLRCAETLRREGYDGELVLVGDEKHRPYDRPPLSKQVLWGEYGEDRIALVRPEAYEALRLELRTGVAATGLDLGRREVQLADGTRLGFDGLAVTTGARSRTPPRWSRPGVHDLRSLDDSLAIRDAFARSPRLVVIGGGFIGCEVAAAGRRAGLEVTLVEALPAPLQGVLGSELAGVVADIHRDEGVKLRCGIGVAGIEGGAELSGVRLNDGSFLEADLAVTGVGVRPATDWLAGSGLDLGDGVACDERCLAAEGVVAAGDVASWWNPLYRRRMRLEHWSNASEQAMAAARRLLRGSQSPPYAPAPYFWSDQYEHKLQVVGVLSPAAEHVVAHGSLAERRFVVLAGEGGVLTGAVALNWPRLAARYRRLIAAAAPFAEALAAAAEAE